MWGQTYGGTDGDRGYFVVETSDGGYAIAGYTEFYGAGNDDVWLIKTDEYDVAPVVAEASWVILPLLLAATLFTLSAKRAAPSTFIRKVNDYLTN